MDVADLHVKLLPKVTPFLKIPILQLKDQVGPQLNVTCFVKAPFIHAYRYGSTVFVLENHENQWRVPEIWRGSQKFQILSFMKKKRREKEDQQTLPFRFFSRVAVQGSFTCVIRRKGR